MEAPRDPLDDVRRDVLEIQQRNARVEQDKAWETSWTRRLVIAVAIWAGAWPWLASLGAEHAERHAVVPSVAYLVSTLSLPIVKRWWMRIRFG
ncbi:MAG TPA: hypothetical protein VK932_06835 [Kofleriaceae bacterium]|nr:hypothetical protein [Kofleriaceae bacterium]